MSNCHGMYSYFTIDTPSDICDTLSVVILSAFMYDLKMEKKIALEKLAQNIRRIRLERDLSQEELSALAGFDRTYISLLERAKRNPSFYNLVKLSKGLNVSLSELLKEVEV